MPDSLAPLLNDTKWEELRLAMYELGSQSPRFRVKDIEATQPGPWDGEWFYHFRDGGYRSLEWVELQLCDQSQRDAVASILASINLPGVHTDAGFIVYGHVAPGTPVEYIRSSSKKLELMKSGPGQVEVSFEFWRHLGPRFVHGAVRLQFDSMQPYSFVSEAKWPENDNYEAAVRAGVEQVLLERMGMLEKVSVVLKGITFHPVDSSAEGFRRAARAATEAAFNTSQS